MERIVVDSNIIYDFKCTGNVEKIFRVNIKFIAPTILVEDELNEDRSELARLGLISLDLEKTKESADDLKIKYPQLSMADIHVILLSKEQGYRILTGDKALRNIADKLDIEVHGTLWLMKRLVDCGALSMSRAACSLETMLRYRRLPEKETWLLISELRSQDTQKGEG